MYHYTSCGLPNIYLKNGFKEYETPYGKGVAIEDVPGLHKAIAMAIIESPSKLTGKEIKFLRKELNLSQKRLGLLLGVEDQTVARWEKEGPTSMADRFVRVVAMGHYEDDDVKVLIEKLAELDRKDHESFCFEESDHGWKEAIAA
ncbi:helix-turn-helix domain-containing protein [Marinobacterium weihaiense]|uniref:Helix-turn-helix domain-containing protein n=1 Tax=Marinobacterium weihaiense TaxID=2851016 RepID=A0ABS6M7W8_9GAMM|nr:helix-turn-helix domain-containing protein [Marinobacterium weihaiense]MBV0932375.1 helix-turn-helix domain-containing protein [Marinobacterium weihaiense]